MRTARRAVLIAVVQCGNTRAFAASGALGAEEWRPVPLESTNVGVTLVYETHSTTEDNEAGRATGWLPGRLSERGVAQAHELGLRRADDGIAAVFCSDLARAVETAQIAFGGSGIPVLHDWRLRECDYGECNGMPAPEMEAHRGAHLDVPYPGGESWRQAVDRVGRFVADLPGRWEGRRVVAIGHVATFWGLRHAIDRVPLENLMAAGFTWQPGWEFPYQAPLP